MHSKTLRSLRWGTITLAITHMNRREMLKSSSAAAFASLSSHSAHAASRTDSTTQSVSLYDIFETSLQGPSDGNPFLDVAFGAIFTLEHRSVKVDGFYDGQGTYKVRFMADTQGQWNYVTTSSSSLLNNKTGGFRCVVAASGNHG